MTGIRKTGRHRQIHPQALADASFRPTRSTASTPMVVDPAQRRQRGRRIRRVFGPSSSLPSCPEGCHGHALGASNLLEVVGLAGLLPKEYCRRSRTHITHPQRAGDLVIDEPRHLWPDTWSRPAAASPACTALCHPGSLVRATIDELEVLASRVLLPARVRLSNCPAGTQAGP